MERNNCQNASTLNTKSIALKTTPKAEGKIESKISKRRIFK